jgi:periplasmic copper chaperone A
MRSYSLWLASVALTGSLLSACGDDNGPSLIASNIVISEPLPGRAMSAGYLTLSNRTNSDMRISEVDSLQFGYVEIHESVLEDGIAKMLRLKELVVPAKTSVSLQPGGKHLMLMRPVGNPEKVTLNFYDGETLLLSVQASVTRRNN